jgi:hypothetical protein
VWRLVKPYGIKPEAGETRDRSTSTN